jgi:holo-[acyl-carrier protein] synthase
MHIGIDLIEADRFSGMNRDRLSHMFTVREMDYFADKNYAPETIAGMFCAKEAFFKALGTGITQNNILDVEILHDMHGAPYYHLNPKLITENKQLSTAKTHISISNTKALSVAVCAIIPSYIGGMALN